MGTTSLVTLAILVALGVFAATVYNRLVTLRNTIGNAFAQIDVQLKRRYDLIPNLVETARKYLQHERETLEAVIAARNTALGRGRPGTPEPVRSGRGGGARRRRGATGWCARAPDGGG